MLDGWDVLLNAFFFFFGGLFEKGGMGKFVCTDSIVCAFS